FWAGPGGFVPANVALETYRLYESMGINSSYEGDGELSYDIRFLERLDMPHTRDSAATSAPRAVTKEQAKLQPDVRGCLDTPEYLERQRGLGEKAGQLRKHEDLFMYTTGDEARGPGVNGCFCQASVHALRDWLRAQYSSISELNTEWGTRFGSFDQ